MRYVYRGTFASQSLAILWYTLEQTFTKLHRVTEAAERLAISRVSLSRVLNGRAGVSTARLWLTLQANYELWQARQVALPVIRSLAPPPQG